MIQIIWGKKPLLPLWNVIDTWDKLPGIVHVNGDTPLNVAYRLFIALWLKKERLKMKCYFCFMTIKKIQDMKANINEEIGNVKKAKSMEKTVCSKC